MVRPSINEYGLDQSWMAIFYGGCVSSNKDDQIKYATRLADSNRWDAISIRLLARTFVEKAMKHARVRPATAAMFASKVYQAFGSAHQDWVKYRFIYSLRYAVEDAFAKWWDTAQPMAVCVGRHIRRSDLSTAYRLLEFIANVYDAVLITRSGLWRMVKQIMNNINVIEHFHGLRLLLLHSCGLWAEWQGRKNKEIFLKTLRTKASALPNNASVVGATFGRRELHGLVSDIVSLVDPWESSAHLASI
ncbi:hypothetical protein OE88DRAFT_1810155 [Heliocybe sulcata]|uniref:Uncharacterized protein n=1 Tax=Heliocybe sulcata TaxID=5364 RepID=A0A5C3MUH8_9AGAM|nr:hypothetical protein OE88DRAFT_1810155 [Heliocybe sulcata]